MNDKAVSTKVNENKKPISFRLNPKDFDNFKALCSSENIGQSEMFGKLLNTYLYKSDVGASAEMTPQVGGAISQPIKFISRLYNRVLGTKPMRSCTEFEGYYMHCDFHTQQPVEAFYFSDLLKCSYGIEDANNYLLLHGVLLAKITSIKRSNIGQFFLGESIRVLRKDSLTHTVWNDWCYILKSAEEVVEKLSDYNSDFQRSQIENMLLYDRGDDNDSSKYEGIFVPNTTDV